MTTYQISTVQVAELLHSFGNMPWGVAELQAREEYPNGARMVAGDGHITVEALPVCPFTHAHTRAWCGYEGCRES